MLIQAILYKSALIQAPPMGGGGGGPIGFNLPGGEEAYTQQVVGGEEGWFSRNKSPNKPPPEVGHKDSSGIPNWVKYTAGGVAAVGVAAVGAYALKKLVGCPDFWKYANFQNCRFTRARKVENHQRVTG